MTKLLKSIGIVLQVLGVIYIAEKVYFFSTTGSFGGRPDVVETRSGHSGLRIAMETPTSGRGFPDEEQQEFNMQVLAAMGIEYTSGFYDGVYSVSWERQDRETEKEIEARIGQYRFIRDVCTQLPLPRPDEPSKEKLSCSAPMPDWYEPIECKGEAELACSRATGTEQTPIDS